MAQHDGADMLRVQPALDAHEIDLVAGLAGAGAGPRRLWPGQPGRRSPWVPCPQGCCLRLGNRRGGDPVTWLRFLIREVLAPAARDRIERSERLGLPGGHRIDGRVVVEGVMHRRRLVVSGRKVRVTPLPGSQSTER